MFCARGVLRELPTGGGMAEAVALGPLDPVRTRGARLTDVFLTDGDFVLLGLGAGLSLRLTHKTHETHKTYGGYPGMH